MTPSACRVSDWLIVESLVRPLIENGRLGDEIHGAPLLEIEFKQ
jgi:hypothetical protein